MADISQENFLFGLFQSPSMAELAKREEARFRELRTNMLRVADQSPEVLEALLEYITLEEALKLRQEDCMEQQPVFLFIRLC